ncbi:hypothetical protein ACS0TY_011218 [Phlomoides rotata]
MIGEWRCRIFTLSGEWRHRGMVIEGLIMPTKTRKRGFSSSRIRNYMLNKRAIVVGKSRARLGIRVVGSRSITPVPAWRNTPSRTAVLRNTGLMQDHRGRCALTQ